MIAWLSFALFCLSLLFPFIQPQVYLTNNFFWTAKEAPFSNTSKWWCKMHTERRNYLTLTQGQGNDTRDKGRLGCGLPVVLCALFTAGIHREGELQRQMDFWKSTSSSYILQMKSPEQKSSSAQPPSWVFLLCPGPYSPNYLFSSLFIETCIFMPKWWHVLKSMKTRRETGQ